MKELIVKPKKVRLLLRLIVALMGLFAFISILIVAFNPTYSWMVNKEILSYIGLPVTYFGMPVCLLIAARTIYILASGKGILIINQDGLTDNSTIFGSVKIRWNEVKGVKLISFLGQKLIGVTLKDDKAVLSRLNKIKRMLMTINLKTTGAPINISVRMIDKPVDEVLKLISNYCK